MCINVVLKKVVFLGLPHTIYRNV
jgi:hypothetical protein